MLLRRRWAAPTTGLSQVALACRTTPGERPHPPQTKEPQGGRVITREALRHRAEEAAGKQEVRGSAVSSKAQEAHGGQTPPCRSPLVLGAASFTRRLPREGASTSAASDRGWREESTRNTR